MPKDHEVPKTLDTPTACSLSPSDQEERLREFSRLASSALLGSERTRDGARLRLRDDPEVEAELSRLIEAEQSCCSFLDFSVDTAGDDLLVEIDGPPAARELIDRLFALPSGARS